MKLLIELNAALFVASAAMLFFILRYRIHLHVEYRSRRSLRKLRRAPAPLLVTGKGKAGEVSGEAIPPQALKDLESALRNLGATPKEAHERATAAVAQGAGDFDALILRALQARPRG